MPNLKPPVSSAIAAEAYYQRIVAATPAGMKFQPLMTLYLTDQLKPEEISRAKDRGLVVAVKYYPAGATTNSESGVTVMNKVYPVLERLAELGMPLLVHGEVTDAHVDIFDREKAFIDTLLEPLTQRFPTLKVVMEHITTADAVSFVKGAGERLAATITPQHLMYNRNHLLVGGDRPCWMLQPVHIRAFSWERIPLHMQGQPRKQPVAVLVVTVLMRQSSCMLKYLIRPGRWINSKHLLPFLGLTFTTYPATPIPSH
jgi:dihydroorotase